MVCICSTSLLGIGLTTEHFMAEMAFGAVLAPRKPTREWDMDKEDMQDEVPGERPPRPPRPEVPLYRPQPRERCATTLASSFAKP